MNGRRLGAGLGAVGAASLILSSLWLGEPAWSARLEPKPLQLVRRAHYVMGTIFEITAYGTGRAQTAASVESAFAAIRASDEVLSHYRDSNPLAGLNSGAGQGAMSVPAELSEVLGHSLKMTRLSGGAFDVTAGALVQLWQRAEQRNHLPSEQELAEALSNVGPDGIHLLSGSRVRLSRPGTQVNFGAIGKGWAVDRALESLKGQGIKNAFISAGTSTIYALGSDPSGMGWLVELRDPRNPDGVTAAAFRLQGAALSTSAGYETGIEIQGRRYSHIIDPRNGRPAENMLSATVISPTATEADALSTAVYVLGVEEGGRLLRRLGREGVLIGREQADGPIVEVHVNEQAAPSGKAQVGKTQVRKAQVVRKALAASKAQVAGKAQ